MNVIETDESNLIDKLASKAENISKTENLSINDSSSNLTAAEEQNLLNNKKNHINEEPATNNNATLSEKEGVICKNVIPIEECKSEGVPMIYKKLPGCKFCDIIHNNSGKIIFENEHCAAFYDKKKKTAKCHILVCSKDHIKNSHEVPKDNISILLQIQKAGEDLLKKLWPDEEYRFGYHEPPMNSVDHLHLHCLVPPIKVKYLDHVVYGIKLASTDKIISKILNAEIGTVKESEGEIIKEKES